MTAFRADFYNALHAMLAVTDHAILTDSLPISSPNNISARILRHGVAVSAFAMLERYIKSVFDQMIDDLSTSNVLYNGLPIKLKGFVIADAVFGLTNVAQFIRDDHVKLAFLEDKILALARFQENPPSYTSYGFSPKGSNIGHEDVKKGFASFLVQDAWRKLTAISGSIGSGYLSLENEYKALAIARHSSAHDPAGNIPTVTLKANLQAAIVIGISIDLLGQAVGHVTKVCSNGAMLESQMQSAAPSLRFLDEQLDGTWGEKTTSSGRIIKKYPNRDAGIASVKVRRGAPAVVIRDSAALPRAVV